ncbi:DUF6524 family protein [Falsiroseomonas selenitidurans]|uniref:DoxX family protein n=1 Tax=Falsiroseomonas selenitidurans TaxID=2716335 RepID=A0ABX1E5N6_9PROT|nr:DUF6524 family protein [Falsiroseomonas selenitidurans]NKC32286.1 hypothetical protein [Falsiroseomonas selenitidurans]
MAAQRFDWKGVVARGLFSLFIVFALYNPSGYSYLHWLVDSFEWFWAKLAVGAALAAVLMMLWRTTRGVLKLQGMLLVALFSLGAGVTLAHLSGMSLTDPEAMLIWALLTLAAIFTAGLSYSHLDHRLGGISHTDEITK